MRIQDLLVALVISFAVGYVVQWIDITLKFEFKRLGIVDVIKCITIGSLVLMLIYLLSELVNKLV